jgi:integrase
MASVRKRFWTSPSGETKAAWFVDYYDSRGQRQRKHFANKKAADAFRISVEGQLASGIYRPDASKLTVKAACEGFTAHCEGRLRRDERMTRKMLAVYRGHINNHILHVEHGIAAWRLSQLTARAVGDFWDRLRNAGATVPTTRKILATLHSVLEYAISQDWIAANPARAIKVIGPRNEGSKKIVPPDKAELSRIIGAANPSLRLMILFAASTGARAGEQWAARWSDVDFDNAQLRISRRVDAYGEEGPPKTAAGVRTVPVSTQL